MKAFIILITLLNFLSLSALAVTYRPPHHAPPQRHHYPRPMPMPHYPSHPVPRFPPVYIPPVYVQPAYVHTCYVRSYNWVSFYGIGTDIFSATQRAHIACQSTGLVCQFVGCQ